MKEYRTVFRKPLRPTIGQYQQLVQLVRDEGINEFDREVKFAAIMMGMTHQQAEEELTRAQIMDINKRYDFPDMDHVVPRLPRRIWIKGRLYKVCPDFTKLNTGEFVSFQHFTRTPWTKVNDLHHIMALFIKPYRIPYILPAKIKEPADVYLERSTLLQDQAPAWMACMVSAFFLQVWNQLYDSTSSNQNSQRKS